MTDDFEVVKEVLIGAHAEFCRKFNGLTVVVFHDECVLLFISIFFVVVRSAAMRSCVCKRSRVVVVVFDI